MGGKRVKKFICLGVKQISWVSMSSTFLIFNAHSALAQRLFLHLLNTVDGLFL